MQGCVSPLAQMGRIKVVGIRVRSGSVPRVVGGGALEGPWPFLGHPPPKVLALEVAPQIFMLWVPPALCGVPPPSV